MSARPSRRLLAGLAALVAAALLGGCVALPESGPVRAAPQNVRLDDDGALDYTPGGPKQGATPSNIVENFLLAMTATPVNTSVARQFLTDASSRNWVPEEGTLVYGSKQITTAGSEATVSLSGTVRLDGRGEWLGDPSHGKGTTFRLHLVKEAGQWRISDPPDALVIPRSHFDSTFTQYVLYFFDKTGQVLVPEPVYVPRGAQAPTVLVAGLLAGPSRDLLGVERSYLPARTQLDDLSVPVSLDGTATVPLTDQMLGLDNDHLALAFAQLAWTLCQIPGVDRMRVTIDGSPLDLPGDGSDLPVDAFTEYDPAVAWASQSLFGLRAGRLVTVSGTSETRTSGVFGSMDLGVRSFGVDLQGEHVAAVTDGGTRVRAGARDGVPGTAQAAVDAPTVYVGKDVLRPVYDLTGQLWLLDRTAAGARVEVVTKGVPRQVTVPGVSGKDVDAFELSRDGTRLVAAVRGSQGDRLLLARVQRDDSGAVRSVGPARELPLPGGPVPVVDLAWRTPASLAVLTRPSSGAAQVLVVRVDGSTSVLDLAADAQPFGDQATLLVTAPTLGAPLYLATADGRFYSLTASGRWSAAGVGPGLTAATFPG